MRFFIICLLFCSVLSAAGQEASIRGSIMDTLDHHPLPNTVISLLHHKDSVLYKFVRADRNGAFQLDHLAPGDYLLLVTYPKFADYVEAITVTHQDKDFGMLPLTQKSALLEAVVIKQHWSIRLKGDTVEYKADSFKTAQGASVKDLLRKLPGLQIDKDGQITAQGQKVEKVLVDGEEFFSDDPAVVIENLRADAIDKVQSYDKKSDQSEFTGVDDGSRSKTLNLVLKDDKKKGYLGKVVMGGGTDERFSGQAMINFFRGKKKASVYGIASNTGVTGLGWEDRGRMGGNDDFEDADVEMGAGFIMINTEGDSDFSDFSNSYDGEGVPRSVKGGAHYSDKWNTDRQKVNGNYTLKNTRVYAKGNSLYKYTLPDSAYYVAENHTGNTLERQHLFNGSYDIKFDSLSSLRVKLNGKMEDRDIRSGIVTETDNEELMVVNRNARLNTANTDASVFSMSALWRQKFRKKGRTASLSLTQKQNNSNSDGFLFSYTDFYGPNGTYLNTDSVDQKKTSRSTKYISSTKLVYTEPVGKKSILEFNHTFQRSSNTLDRRSFDEAGGKYTVLNPLFSLKYGLIYLSNSAGAKYQYTSKKIIANAGSNLGVADYRQQDSTGKQIRHLHYTNLFPTAKFTYRFTSQRTLNLTYSGMPQSPTVEQIQPTRENTNPLFITIGNPALDQAFRHNLSVFFSDFKILSNRNIWINGSITKTAKDITTNQFVNSGVTTQQYVNADGNFYYSSYASYGLKWAKLDIYTGFNLNGTGSNYVNFINGQKNISRNRATGVGFFATKYKESKFEANIGSEVRYNTNKASVNGQRNTFWTQHYNASGSYYFSKRLMLWSDINLDIRQRTAVFTRNNNFTIWNANLSYKVFKKQNGVLKLEVNDMLGQRRGFNREFTANYQYEKNYNTLGRYALLSFTWNFTKTPAQTK